MAKKSKTSTKADLPEVDIVNVQEEKGADAKKKTKVAPQQKTQKEVAKEMYQGLPDAAIKAMIKDVSKLVNISPEDLRKISGEQIIELQKVHGTLYARDYLLQPVKPRNQRVGWRHDNTNTKNESLPESQNGSVGASTVR